MRYDLVIFDSDGTLADTLPWMRGVFNELADAHGFRRVEPHEYDQFRDLHGRELLHALKLPFWKTPRVVADMRRRMTQRTEPFQLFPGIEPLLHQLARADVRLAIVSSNSRQNVERILGPDNARLIQHWACGASVFGKASRIRSVLRASRIDARRALYVGDEIRDALACKEAGVAFGAAGWGQNSERALRAQQPAIFLNRAEEIAKHVLGDGSATGVERTSSSKS